MTKDDREVTNEGDHTVTNVLTRGERVAPDQATRPYGRWVEVSPTVAMRWLTQSEQFAEANDIRVNRRPGTRNIDRYARDMLNNEWDETGVPLIIDVDGVVRDGQQRLAAVIKSGVTVRFNVVFNVQPGVQRNIDNGRRRSPADNLYIKGVPDASNVAAITSLLVAWHSGNVATISYSPTSAEIDSFALEHEEQLLRAARAVRRLRNQLPGCTMSVMGALHFATHDVDPDDAERFFKQLSEGTNLQPGDAILTLRNTITRYTRLVQKPHRNHQLYQAVQAWNAWRQNVPMQLIRVPRTLSNDSFPVAR